MRINIEVVDIVKSGEERIDDILRPLFEWKDKWGDELDISGFEEEKSEVLGHEFTGSISIEIEDDVNDDIGISYISIRDLIESLDINPRRIYFDGGNTLITLKSVPDEESMDEVVDEWRKKWAGGKYPFRTNIYQLNDNHDYLIFVKFRDRFTAYQLRDLIDYKMPDVKSFVK